MFELIPGMAERDERIRGVYMNGSRTNPNVPEDIFQDYDVVYVVRETKSFIKDKHWIEQFGEILYMQLPDEFPAPEEECCPEKSYGWLVQFADGVRMCDLFERTARYVGAELGYTYNETEGANSRGYLEHVRILPQDAEGVYE